MQQKLKNAFLAKLFHFFNNFVTLKKNKWGLWWFRDSLYHLSVKKFSEKVSKVILKLLNLKIIVIK